MSKSRKTVLLKHASGRDEHIPRIGTEVDAPAEDAASRIDGFPKFREIHFLRLLMGVIISNIHTIGVSKTLNGVPLVSQLHMHYRYCNTFLPFTVTRMCAQKKSSVHV